MTSTCSKMIGDSGMASLGGVLFPDLPDNAGCLSGQGVHKSSRADTFAVTMPSRARRPPDSDAPDSEAVVPAPTKDERQLAAALLGRLGGLKGGRARAKALSPTKRRAIAKKAAAARWRTR